MAAPLALVPLPADVVFGRILPGDSRHGAYAKHLDRVLENGFARFMTL